METLMRRLLDLRRETPTGSVGRAPVDHCVELHHQGLAANDEALPPRPVPSDEAPQACGGPDPPKIALNRPESP